MPIKIKFVRLKCAINFVFVFNSDVHQLSVLCWMLGYFFLTVRKRRAHGNEPKRKHNKTHFIARCLLRNIVCFVVFFCLFIWQAIVLCFRITQPLNDRCKSLYLHLQPFTFPLFSELTFAHIFFHFFLHMIKLNYCAFISMWFVPYVFCVCCRFIYFFHLLFISILISSFL